MAYICDELYNPSSCQVEERGSLSKCISYKREGRCYSPFFLKES